MFLLETLERLNQVCRGWMNVCKIGYDIAFGTIGKSKKENVKT
jgi:hypothetical protein